MLEIFSIFMCLLDKFVWKGEENDLKSSSMIFLKL